MADASTETPPEEKPSETTPQDNAEADQAKDLPKEDEVKLYVGNLSYSTTRAHLNDEFGKYGEITDVFLPTDRMSGRPRGFGFVTFSTKASADEAIANLNGKDLDGRTITVNYPKPRGESSAGGRGGGAAKNDKEDVKLYVGNLSFDTSKESLQKLFEQHGTVTDCFLPENRDTGKPRGFGFVTMPTKDAEKAIEAVNGFEFDGRTLRVNEARGRYDSGYGGGGGRRGRRY